MFENSQNISDPYIISGVIILLLSFLIPCTIWFIRNWIRAIKRKEYYELNKTLKYSWLFGLLLFISAIIIFVVRTTM